MLDCVAKDVLLSALLADDTATPQRGTSRSCRLYTGVKCTAPSDSVTFSLTELELTVHVMINYDATSRSEPCLVEPNSCCVHVGSKLSDTIRSV